MAPSPPANSTSTPRVADPQPGTRPDPELGRRGRLDLERAGLPPEPAEELDDEIRDPVVVLADCMDREDAEAVEVGCAECWSLYLAEGRNLSSLDSACRTEEGRSVEL